MNKELQDLAWSILPKEFKEEVKIYYQVLRKQYNGREKTKVFRYLFGLHNLTSDAEGEEILTVKASTVKDIYNSMNKAHPKENAWVVKQTLEALFGSKCLPDETKDETKDDTKEPTPAEPKYHVGDWVRAVSTDKQGHIGQIAEVEYKYGCNYYQVSGTEGWHFLGKNLEPYTEPEGNVNLSQETANCDKQFDTILKDSFSKERRLNIAAQFMSAMMSNPSVFHRGLNSEEENFIIYGSLEFADTLIAEALKGDTK